MLLVSRASAEYPSGIEVGLEEFLRHRRRDPVAPARRQRLENHRRIEVALVIGGENHRAAGTPPGARALDLRATRRRGASGRIHVGRLARRSARIGDGTIPGREVDRLGGRTIARAARCRLRADGVSASRSADGGRGGKFRLVDRDLHRFLERHHQLDAFERAQPELVDRRARRDRSRPGAKRSSTDAHRARRVGAACGAACRCAAVASHSCSSRRLSFRVPSVRGSSAPGPERRGADFLVILEPGIGLLHHVVEIRPGAATSTACTRSAVRPGLRRADDGRLVHPRHARSARVRRPRERVQAFRRDDHLLLPAADPQLALGVELADVAGMEPAVHERRARLLGRVVVAAS